MSDDVVDGEKCTLIPHTFNTIEILTIDYGGTAVLLAQQVGEALGYADPSKLANNISQKWADDFEEGRDFIKLTNGRLAAFKAAVNYRPDRAVVVEDHHPDRAVVDPQSRHLILLTESGAQLAAILSRTPQGRAFRRWLVDVVLPERRKGHPVDPPAPASPPKRQRGRPRGAREVRQLPKALSLDELMPTSINEWPLGLIVAYDTQGESHPFISVRDHLIWRAVSLFEECKEDLWRGEVLKGLASVLGMKLATFEGDPLLERAEEQRWILRAQAKELLHRLTDLQLVRALTLLGRQMGIFSVVSAFPIRREGWRWEPGPNPADELRRVQAELARVTSELQRISSVR